MKQIFACSLAVIGWFAIITQYVLMLESRVTSLGEALIRFFSYFTILTNILVALYFSFQLFGAGRPKFLHRPGTLTALTVYITVVGLVYQFLLRHLVNLSGLPSLVDELLHSVIPLLVILYWYLYEHKAAVNFSRLGSWLLYPAVYLTYILLRGNISGFYPYPFVNVTQLGLIQVLINSFFIALVFVLVSSVFVSIGRRIGR